MAESRYQDPAPAQLTTEDLLACIALVQLGRVSNPIADQMIPILERHLATKFGLDAPSNLGSPSVPRQSEGVRQEQSIPVTDSTIVRVLDVSLDTAEPREAWRGPLHEFEASNFPEDLSADARWIDFRADLIAKGFSLFDSFTACAFRVEVV